jgi:hypothetical protein
MANFVSFIQSTYHLPQSERLYWLEKKHLDAIQALPSSKSKNYMGKLTSFLETFWVDDLVDQPRNAIGDEAITSIAVSGRSAAHHHISARIKSKEVRNENVEEDREEDIASESSEGDVADTTPEEYAESEDEINDDDEVDKSDYFISRSSLGQGAQQRNDDGDWVGESESSEEEEMQKAAAKPLYTDDDIIHAVISDPEGMVDDEDQIPTGKRKAASTPDTSESDGSSDEDIGQLTESTDLRHPCITWVLCSNLREDFQADARYVSRFLAMIQWHIRMLVYKKARENVTRTVSVRQLVEDLSNRWLREGSNSIFSWIRRFLHLSCRHASGICGLGQVITKSPEAFTIASGKYRTPVEIKTERFIAFAQSFVKDAQKTFDKVLAHYNITFDELELEIDDLVDPVSSAVPGMWFGNSDIQDEAIQDKLRRVRGIIAQRMNEDGKCLHI